MGEIAFLMNQPYLSQQTRWMWGFWLMTSVVQQGRQGGVISTGSIEIDRRIGGGIPYATLMLIEGESSSGKSTLTQQLLCGCLTSGEDAAVYVTEQTVQSLLRQMDSLALDVRDYFLLDHLQIFPISIPPDSLDAGVVFQELSNHIGRQEACRVIIIDSLTTFISHAGETRYRTSSRVARPLATRERSSSARCTRTLSTRPFSPGYVRYATPICASAYRGRVRGS